MAMMGMMAAAAGDGNNNGNNLGAPFTGMFKDPAQRAIANFGITTVASAGQVRTFIP
jgi:hypothetical protein